jgi:hypothetical protein
MTNMLAARNFLWTNERIMQRHNAIMAKCQRNGLSPYAALFKCCELAYTIAQDAHEIVFQLTGEKRFLQIEVDRQADQFMQTAIELDRLCTAYEQALQVGATLRKALLAIDEITSEAEAWKDFSDGTVPLKDVLKIGKIAQKAMTEQVGAYRAGLMAALAITGGTVIESAELDRLRTELAERRRVADNLAQQVMELNQALAQDWRPVEDDIELPCDCGSPDCTNTVYIPAEGATVTIVDDGYELTGDLGEYRICKKVSNGA